MSLEAKTHMRIIHEGIPYDVELRDDGTQDTVLRVGSRFLRFSPEDSAPYRDARGAFTEDSLRMFFIDYVVPALEQ